MGEDTSKTQFYQDRKLVLLILLVALTVLVWMLQWNTGSSFADRESKSSKASDRKSSNKLVDLRLLVDQLNQEQPPLLEEKRNLFNFYQAPTPVPPPPPVPPEQAVCGNQLCEEGEDYQNCPTDCQPPTPPVPPITLRYIGYMSEEGKRVVFLTDGKEVYIGRVNDIIANKYRVLKITEESVELGYLNINETRTIPFQGNQGG